MTDRRALSDAIGFVLIFAIITASIGVFYAVGFEGLESTRTAERTNNAERAFDVMRSNIDDISSEGAPSRATEIKVAEADLYVAEKAEINVTLRYHSNGSIVDTNGTTQPGTIEYRPVVYDSNDEEGVVYANGAVFRRSQGDSYSMTQEPGFVFTDERLLMTIVHTQADRNLSVSGSSTVLVRALEESRSVVFSNSELTYDVDIDMTTPRADAWARYFEDKGLSCTVSGEDLDCTYSEVKRVHVQKVRIQLLFE